MWPLERWHKQMIAFAEITIDCDRCGKQTPLSYLTPCRASDPSFICRICLHTMTVAEFQEIRLDC